MGVLDGFDVIWSKARSTFGDGPPVDGSGFDKSGQLRRLESTVRSAQPSAQWTGSAADSYSSANERQNRVLGRLAELDRRLRAEVDRSAQVVIAGRQNLDAIRQWVHDTAASVPPGANRERVLLSVVSRGATELSEVIQRSDSDMRSIAGRINGIKDEYQFLGAGFGGFPQGAGDHEGTQEEEPSRAEGDEPWRYPFDPPPPNDSAPGGGRWVLGQAYPPGPDGGPPVGVAPPKPWHRDIEPPVVGGTSGLQEIAPPPPNGWGVQPAWTMQEAYRFRVTGEGFNGDPSHVRWVEQNGKWYQATWVDYDLERERVTALVPHNDGGGYPTLHWGQNKWEPIDIKDVYQIQARNPRLPLYIPNPFGGQHHIPVPSRDHPVIVSGG